MQVQHEWKIINCVHCIYTVLGKYKITNIKEVDSHSLLTLISYRSHTVLIRLYFLALPDTDTPHFEGIHSQGRQEQANVTWSILGRLCDSNVRDGASAAMVLII